MKIKEKLPTAARLEFYGIRGKIYTLQSSPDLKTWSAVDFSLTAPGSDPAGNAQSTLTATTTGLSSIYAATPSAPAAGSGAAYYRLQIR